MIEPSRFNYREPFHVWYWRRERAKYLDQLPTHARRFIADRTNAIADTKGSDAANVFVIDRWREFQRAKTYLATEESELNARAHECADICRPKSLPAMRDYVIEKGLALPKYKHLSNKGERARYTSPDWWRRQLRRLHCRLLEDAERNAGLVHRAASVYVSQDSMRRYVQQQDNQRRYIRETEALCLDTGEIMPLETIQAASLANPANRRHELMTVISGLEEYATAEGHQWLFAVVTLPSEYHAFTQDGKRNERYAYHAVRFGHRQHCKFWARLRAGMSRAAALYYGLRTVEAHHDGTAHWNLLVFGPPDSLRVLEKLLWRRWLAESPDEPGAALHRVRVIYGDQQKGSAAGYVAKYISKGTDARALETDDAKESDLSGKDSTFRNIAWARIHGVRQFQFFGTPTRGTWRELRRIRTTVDTATIERARAAADTGDFRAYISAMGNLETARATPPVTVDKAEPRETDPEGRSKFKLNRWGELPLAVPIGVKCIENGRIKRCQTRTLKWRLQNRVHALCLSSIPHLGPVAITVRSAPTINEPTGWTNPRETGTYGPVDPISIYGF